MQRRPLLFLTGVLLLCTAIVHPAAAGAADLPADYAIFDGHFYSQANGQGGAGGTGYTVTNDGGVPFWTAFSQAGGVAALGYPAGQRYQDGGFTEQVFQKGVLQWNGTAVAFLNILDVLHDAGKDPWLTAAWMTPPPAPTSADTGLDWAAVVARHDAFLDTAPALRRAYFAVADPLDRYGLPVSPVTPEGAAFVVRCQRAVLQLWTQSEPWAAPGTVTVANGGDILKASGVLPAAAIQPSAPPVFTYAALGASDAAGVGASSPDKGYVSLLGAHLAARYGGVTTDNLGIGGATTADIAAQEAPRLAALHPTVVTITTGANDIIHGVPPNQFNANLDNLLSLVQSAHPGLVVIANIPDFSLAPAVPDALRPLVETMVLADNVVVSVQARAHGALVVDLYGPSEQLLPSDPSLISGDGFHPDDAGYALYAATFWPVIQNALP